MTVSSVQNAACQRVSEHWRGNPPDARRGVLAAYNG